jgi:hypothetical protein
MIRLLFILIFISSCSFAPAAKNKVESLTDKFCYQALEESEGTCRRIMSNNRSAKLNLLTNVGECVPVAGSLFPVCNLRESYGECGEIIQHFDVDGNMTCDFVMQWSPVISTDFGVYYALNGGPKPCPTEI